MVKVLTDLTQAFIRWDDMQEGALLHSVDPSSKKYIGRLQVKKSDLAFLIGMVSLTCNTKTNTIRISSFCQLAMEVSMPEDGIIYINDHRIDLFDIREELLCGRTKYEEVQ